MPHPITVYMLHMTYPNGHVAHYVGSTRTERLMQRIAEHTRGTGAQQTTAAVSRGATVKLGCTIGVPDRASEVFFAASDAHELVCSVCGVIRTT